MWPVLKMLGVQGLKAFKWLWRSVDIIQVTERRIIGYVVRRTAERVLTWVRRRVALPILLWDFLKRLGINTAYRSSVRLPGMASRGAPLRDAAFKPTSLYRWFTKFGTVVHVPFPR